MTRRIETQTSRTAEWTCLSRAVSYLEKKPQYKSDDSIALRILPAFMQVLVKIPPVGRAFIHRVAPTGMYEYVIARTKYIDRAYQSALKEGLEQIVILGAGFDSRAERFPAESTRVFELDSPITQTAKTRQYARRRIAVPSNLVFVPIDFEEQNWSSRLIEEGFRKGRKSLFILEGLTMYLKPESVDETFAVIAQMAGERSRVVFDFVYASVLRGEGRYAGESEIVRSTQQAGEAWRFGIEQGEVRSYLDARGFCLLEQLDASELEKRYMCGDDGKPVGRINGTHCIVKAEVRRMKDERYLGQSLV